MFNWSQKVEIDSDIFPNFSVFLQGSSAAVSSPSSKCVAMVKVRADVISDVTNIHDNVLTLTLLDSAIRHVLQTADKIAVAF